jgi:hypothetical protein
MKATYPQMEKGIPEEWKKFRNYQPPREHDRTNNPFSPTKAREFAGKLKAAKDFEEFVHCANDLQGLNDFYMAAYFAMPYLIGKEKQSTFGESPFAQLAEGVEQFLGELELKFGKPNESEQI